MITQTPNWTARIVTFWPTIVMRQRLADHHTHNPELVRVVQTLNQRTEQLTTAYQGADFLGIDEPSVRWLKHSIDKSIQEYFNHHAMDYAIDWSLQAWANVNRYGDYHAPHNHGWCYLSGTYYLAMPENSPDTSNAISFYDPRGAVNMLANAGNATPNGEQTFRPQEGTLLLWHSAVQHLVHPNLTAQTRITISFNVVLNWQNHYVEQ